MAGNHNADAAREPIVSVSPPAYEAEHRALLRPSSFISAISDNNEGCEERAFEPSEKVIVYVLATPKATPMKRVPSMPRGAACHPSHGASCGYSRGLAS